MMNDLKERLEVLRGKLGLPSVTLNMAPNGMLLISAFTACQSPDDIIRVLKRNTSAESFEIKMTEEGTLWVSACLGNDIYFDARILHAELEYSQYSDTLREKGELVKEFSQDLIDGTVSLERTA